MIVASKERAAATCRVVSDHQIVQPPALTFRAPYRRGPTGLPNARGRRADGTDTGFVWPEHRQERVRGCADRRVANVSMGDEEPT
jgi:hypothetical protein